MKKIFALILAVALLSTEVSSAATVFGSNENFYKKKSEVKMDEEDKQALTALIAQQRAQGALVSEDLSSDEYVWNNETGKLEEIRWTYKYIKGDISFSAFDELVNLDCAYNAITSLDVQGCTKLEILDCAECSLQELNLYNNLNLCTLYCNDNNISSLDLNFTDYFYCVNCSDNKMKELKMEKVTSGVFKLHCHGNKVKSITVGEEAEGEYYHLDEGVVIKGKINDPELVDYITKDFPFCWCYEEESNKKIFMEQARNAKKENDTKYPTGSEVVVETKQELYDVLYYLTDVVREVSEFPSIVIKNYNPDKFYLGEVLYEINQEAGKNRRYIISNPNNASCYTEKTQGYKGKDFNVTDYMLFFSYELLAKDGELPDTGIIVKNQKELRKTIMETFSKKKSSLKINQLYSYPLVEIETIINYLQKRCGLYSVRYTLQGDGEGAYSMLHVKSVKKLSKKAKKLNQKADKIIKRIIKKGMSDGKKVTKIHDYLLDNCKYAYDGINKAVTHTAYGALINGKCVCQGYAEAFDLLAKKAGVETCMVVAPAMNHSWNMVRINGEMRYVDATWDDTGNNARHRYLLLTENQMKKSHRWNVKKYKREFKAIYESKYSELYKKYCE